LFKKLGGLARLTPLELAMIAQLQPDTIPSIPSF
jgi:hypothetical protein